jgi:hypothetical protein
MSTKRRNGKHRTATGCKHAQLSVRSQSNKLLSDGADFDAASDWVRIVTRTMKLELDQN